jgi:hypothetical protein
MGRLRSTVATIDGWTSSPAWASEPMSNVSAQIASSADLLALNATIEAAAPGLTLSGAGRETWILHVNEPGTNPLCVNRDTARTRMAWKYIWFSGSSLEEFVDVLGVDARESARG